MKTAPALPKFDGDAALALYDANVETLFAVQKVMFDLVRTVAGRQVALVKETLAKLEAATSNGIDGKRPTQSYIDEAKAAVEKAVADAKETVELGLKAQSEVSDLVTKRVKANVAQVTARAA
ncbi:MAG TPA: TIGR01841 family phasin [Geminicoccaceae bacterium]|nr:TIGR01841 family phasin [Geminicoccaceae bacterium]